MSGNEPENYEHYQGQPRGQAEVHPGEEACVQEGVSTCLHPYNTESQGYNIKFLIIN